MPSRQSLKHLVHYAFINDQGQIVRCDWRLQRRWQESAEGKSRRIIEQCRIGNQRIEIRFHGRSETLEQEPPRFWYVHLALSGRPKRGRAKPRGPEDRAFWELAASDPLARDPAEPRGLEDALRCCREGRRVLFSSGHESPELARQYYQEFVDAVKEGEKARRRLKRLGDPDELEELLAQVSGWCSEQRGRQTQIAKAIGTKPQTISQWKQAASHIAERVRISLNTELRNSCRKPGLAACGFANDIGALQ
jgi:hypothetical protein